MGKLSKTKGQVWEREVAGLLREALGLEGIKRGLQSRGGGAEVPDVQGVPLYHVECKHGRAVSWQAALRQAQRDAAEGLYPLVVIKDHGNAEPSPFVVTTGAGWRALSVALRARTGSAGSPIAAPLVACKASQLREGLKAARRAAAQGEGKVGAACVDLRGELILAVGMLDFFWIMGAALGEEGRP